MMARKFSDKAYIASTGATLDVWCDLLDAADGRSMARGDIQIRLQRDHGIAPFWANSIIANYSERNSLGQSGKMRNGKIMISAKYKAYLDSESLFKLALQSDAL